MKEKKVKIKKVEKRQPRVKEKKNRKSVTFKESDEKTETETEAKINYDDRWSKFIPENVLLKIFEYAVRREGALPLIKRCLKNMILL